MAYMTKGKKVIIIGLDCAAPELVFERWLEKLPNMKKLIDSGVYGELESIVPPITVPAWTSMMTSRDPGELGVYGFRNRKDYSYDGMSFATSLGVKKDTVWDLLSRAGKKSILIGVPQTYPPKPINGYMISCFMTPSIKSQYTYPPDLKGEIAKIVGDYMLDVDNFRSNNKQQILDDIYRMTEKRFKIARHMIQSKEWDFFMMVEMGVDRIHHSFWKYFDKEHIKYEPGSHFKGAVLDYYQYIDKEIGLILSLLDKDTTVIVVSDHGAKRMDGGICINEWLMQEGYLALEDIQQGIIPIAKRKIDWSKTKVWGEGGYYGRIFLNVKGREPQGVVDPDDYEKIRDEIIQRLESLGDEDGNPIGTRVYKPQELYKECNGIPPDLIAIFGNLYWRSVGSVGHGKVHTFENDTGPDDANHSQYGIFIMNDRDSIGERGKRIDNLHLMDIAPTVLDLFGIEVQKDMKGRIIRTADDPYNEDEEEEVRKRLKGLGYVE